MTKEQQIRQKLGDIYPQLEINTKKVCGAGYEQWGHNLLSHIIIEFLSMDINKQYKIAIEDDSLEFYITRSMAISLKSSTSTFYRVWRREMDSHRELLPDYKYEDYNNENDDDETKHTKECLDYHVQNTLDFYDKYLIMEHYYKGSNLSVIAEKTGIQPYRITADIKQALKKLKKLCGDNI